MFDILCVVFNDNVSDSNAVKLMEINKCEEVKLAKRKTAEIEELKKRLDEKMASSDQVSLLI